MSQAPPIPPCIHCGFDLTGLPSDSVCPECGGERPAEDGNIQLHPAHARAIAQHLSRASSALRAVVWACIGVGGWMAVVVTSFATEIYPAYSDALVSTLLLICAVGLIILAVSLVRIASLLAAARELTRNYEAVFMPGWILRLTGWVGAAACCILGALCVQQWGRIVPTLPPIEPLFVIVLLFVVALTSATLSCSAFWFTGTLQTLCDATLAPAKRMYFTFGAAFVGLSFAAMFLVLTFFASDMNVFGAAFCSALTPFFLARGLRQWRELHDRLHSIAAQRHETNRRPNPDTPERSLP